MVRLIYQRGTEYGDAPLSAISLLKQVHVNFASKI
jgi:hypothetical protein